MTDTPAPKEGQGKAVSGSITTFFGVMIALTLNDVYPVTFTELKNNGYPLNMVAAIISAVLVYVVIWWTSKDLVSRVLSAIADWKRIVKAWNSPPT
jgi:hypothetical protein